jgi:hypothetical protein
MSSVVESPRHPLLAALSAARDAVSAALEANAWSASDEETLAALSEVEGLRRQADAALLSVVREVDGRALARSAGVFGTAGLLQRRHGLHPRSAKRVVDLASTLTAERPATGAALAAGELSVEHAGVIAAGLRALAEVATPVEVADAEEALIGYAAELDSRELAVCASRIQEALTRRPDIDDPVEAERVRREAEEADRARFEFRRLRITTHRPTKLTAITILVDPFTGRTFERLLAPHAQRESGHDGLVDDRSPAQRDADAFSHLVHTVLATASPHARASAAAIVTIGYETLLDKAGEAGVLDDGTPIDAATMRRLLCTASITPVVLGGPSGVLDVGRRGRLFNRHQRAALAARDRGCVFGACTKTPAEAEAHHMRHWEHGGPTTLDNAAMLCDHHHDRVHREAWEMNLAPNGYPQLHPPAILDPTRKPRQHPRFLTVRRE